MATEATRERPQTGSPGGVLSSHARERPTRLHSRAVTTVDPKLLLNRELSWLEFNQRVLDEAGDATVPLLERVKFLSIVATNLDEFFMIRVAGLKQQAAGGDIVDPPGDGLTPQEQLTQIAPRVHRIPTITRRQERHDQGKKDHQVIQRRRLESIPTTEAHTQ